MPDQSQDDDSGQMSRSTTNDGALVVNGDDQEVDSAALVAAATAISGDASSAPNLQQMQQQQPPQQEDMWSVMKKIMYRMIIFYLISNLIRGFFQPSGFFGSQPNDANSSGSGAAVRSPGSSPGAGRPSQNLFKFTDELDFYIYLSESDKKFDKFDDPSALFWHLKSFNYGDWYDGPNGDGSYTKSVTLEPTPSLQNNGSLYLHVFVTKSGFQPDPSQQETYSKRHTFYKSHRLNKYKKKRYQKTTNLLTGKSEQSEEDNRKAESMTTEILSHWHPNLTLNLVTDQTNWIPGSVPPPLDEFIDFEPATQAYYYPALFFNDYWNLMADYQPINKTVTGLNFTLTVAPISLFKWQIYAAHNMRNRWSKMLGSSSVVSSLFEEEEQQDDQDSLKQAMLDTNPYLLGLTIAVSILHTIFEFLAFKNDIQFWRNRKSLEGLSVKSVVFNLITSVIVLLYILDNETNFVVRLSVGVGVLIELWKIPKCMDVSLNWERKIFGLIPMLSIKDKGSYIKSSTKEYDTLAFRYLSWLLYPLLVGFAVYSLMYQEHRGWYSWVLSMLYGFLLTFGFIMMTPQLFINYKLKSVAHLPWRMLTYKFLNTFIDDIFAFVIKMPTMYRLGCFRDDIIFLIYLYQRWIYRVDPHRLNEFGTSGEMEVNPGANDPMAIDQDVGQRSIENGPVSANDQNENGDKAQSGGSETETETKKDK